MNNVFKKSFVSGFVLTIVVAIETAIVIGLLGWSGSLDLAEDIREVISNVILFGSLIVSGAVSYCVMKILDVNPFNILGEE